MTFVKGCVTDLSEYMRNRTEWETVSELLDVKDGKVDDKVKLYAVIASLYNDAASYVKQSEFETAIPRVFNSHEFFSKNYAPAEEKFIEIYSKLRKEHIGGFLNNQKEKKGDCTLKFSTFSVMPEGRLDFLHLGYSKGWAAWAIGTNLYIGLKKIHVPLEKIIFSEKKKELCYVTPRHMSSGVYYHSIIMD